MRNAIIFAMIMIPVMMFSQDPLGMPATVLGSGNHGTYSRPRHDMYDVWGKPRSSIKGIVFKQNLGNGITSYQAVEEMSSETIGYFIFDHDRLVKIVAQYKDPSDVLRLYREMVAEYGTEIDEDDNLEGLHSYYWIRGNTGIALSYSDDALFVTMERIE